MIAAAASPLNRAYLDYNATAPLRAEAREAALAAMETTGNPSSVHAEGRAARRIVEDARSEVARLAGVSARCVTFVSGGTEAANAALNPLFGGGPNAAPLERLIVSAGEHACVLSGHRFPTAEAAPLLPDGRIDLDWLEAACRRPGRALVALQGANNETGVIQPVAEAAALVHAADGFLFCDAVQMAGRMACEIAALGADALMLSAHKMGGLKGAGALVVARAGVSLGAPLMRGGGQERGARAGTESVAAIAAFGAAARACLAELDGEPARLIGAARSPDNRRPFGRRRRGGLCRDRSAAAQHRLLRRSRRRGRDADDRARSRRRRGEFGLGLLVGQGGAVACAGGDGRSSRAGARRDPPQSRLGVDGSGRRPFRCGVRKRHGADAGGAPKRPALAAETGGYGLRDLASPRVAVIEV